MTPRSVTSDASAQVEKTIRDYSEDHNLNIKHYHCFIHKLRTLQKNLRSIRLKTRLAAGQDREAFIQRLATCIRARIRYKLVKIRRLCRVDATFLRHAQNAVLNVLPCFSGIHDKCRRSSFTCCAHLPGYTTFRMENTWTWTLPTWMPFSPSSASISAMMVSGKSASWQPLTGVRTSTSVSSRTRPRTPRGPGTSQPCATLQSTPPRMAPASPW